MKKVRIGVLGAYRGTSMINYCKRSDNAEVVAICDKLPEALEAQRRNAKGLNITFYDNFDSFIMHDMDAVVLANYANEHAPFAIKAMKRGLHVFSEVLPCQTMKEAVELIETVEETGKIYVYGENYCYMPAPHEMKKLYRQGKIGEFEYGECEYIHNCEPIWHSITYGERDHWRNNMYSTFYCTHSLGPIIHMTGLRPVKVVGFEGINNERNLRTGAKGGQFGIEMVTLENGGIIKSVHGNLYKDSIWYSVYGSKGRMECGREDAKDGHIHKIYVNADEYSGEYGEEKLESYEPVNEITADIKGFGHGGSDFYSMYHFVEKILGKEDADTIDVYEALDMFLPGMFAYRSILNGGIPMDIPDLRNKNERDKWRNDTACTDSNTAGNMLLPTFSKGTPDIDDGVYEHMKNLWDDECKNGNGNYRSAAFSQGRKNDKSEPKQLIMKWKNDGTECIEPTFPEGVASINYTNLSNAMTQWLDIVRFMGQEGAPAKDEAYYKEAMTDMPYYSEDKCFFLTVNGIPAATITVICDTDKKEGYIHMVACKPEFRGKGLGHLLNDIAVYTLKKEGMKTAYLTTDDWRIPAIKTYLKAGLYPDIESEPDFAERWDKIMSILQG